MAAPEVCLLCLQKKNNYKNNVQLPEPARNNEVPLSHDTCATQMCPLGLSTFSNLANMGDHRDHPGCEEAP